MHNFTGHPVGTGHAVGFSYLYKNYCSAMKSTTTECKASPTSSHRYQAERSNLLSG